MLCNLLAFWTGPDPQRIDGLFRQSGLCREKWDVRHHSNGQTYGQHTIAEALTGRTEFYDWSKRKRRNRKKTGSAVSSDLPALSLQLPAGRTEMANAERLFTAHGSDLHWCDPWKVWLVWDGKRWSVDERRGVEALAKGVIHKLWSELAELIHNGDDDTLKPILAFLKASESCARNRRHDPAGGSEPGIPVLPPCA